MKLHPADIEKFAKRFMVKPGKDVNMKKDFDPGDSAGFEKPENADELLQQGVQSLFEYQDRLYAENSRSLLVVLQALDAAGKDSTIKHVMSGVNPQGCQVYSFKVPSSEELDHDYLWRSVKALPARGNIGIFNRSYYEEALVVRVHPEFLVGQRLPPKTMGKGLWPMRFAQINNFEKYLTENGTDIVKIYLNVSKEEQRLRQLERIDTPEKNWKFNAGDLEERKFWDEYMAAYAEIFCYTGTEVAPWYVVPADKKWFTRIAVAAIIANKLIEMDPQYPSVSDNERQNLAVSRKLLVEEGGGKGDSASADSGKNGKNAGKKKDAKKNKKK